MNSSANSRRTALITGVNNPEGIGAALARAFAREGAAVFLTGRPEPEQRAHEGLPPGEERYAALRTNPVEATGEEIERMDRPVHPMAADLADPEIIPVLFDEAEEHLGPVSVLIHNAAHCSADAFVPGDGAGFVSAESHDRHFAVNSRATALLMAEFARRYRDHGLASGRIANISTEAAPGHAGQVSYGASKNALESYSRAAAGARAPRHHGEPGGARARPDRLHPRGAGGGAHPGASRSPPRQAGGRHQPVRVPRLLARRLDHRPGPACQRRTPHVVREKRRSGML